MLGVAALLLTSASASLTGDAQALARVRFPFDGGRIESVSVHGSHDHLVPVHVSGARIWPVHPIAAGERLSIDVIVKRPGSIAWLAGADQRLSLTLLTPSASLSAHFLTLRAGQPIRLAFRTPVQVFAYGPPGAVRRHVLAAPQSTFTLPRTAEAGTIMVAGAPRTWETSHAAMVSWFPAGAAAAAVASPPPGTVIGTRTPITLTFSKPVLAVLGHTTPPVSPATAGGWHLIGSHALQFRPTGFGYGLASTVRLGLPAGVRLVGGTGTGASTGGWQVPAGTTLRLQQILAQLGYLPLTFSPASGGPVAASVAAQQDAAVHPPAGSFHWRYSDTPASLQSFWSPGQAGVITRGALMAFQDDHGLTPDGTAGPVAWRTLIAAAINPKPSTFGYTYVMVSVAGQRLTLWHDGHTVMTTAVNTGIASAPTATGTYPVFEHLPVTTMSGTNPDGSHYDDPGIQYVSYFNGGDALHAFTRAQYGFPQSLGCVEMATGPAGQVYPYTPIGTLVHVG